MAKKDPSSGDSDALRRRIAELEALLVRERATTADLEAQTARHNQLIELMPDTVLVHQNDKIVFANQAAAKVFRAGLSSNLIGMDIRDLIHPDEMHKIEIPRRKLRSGAKSTLLEARRLRLDGSDFLGESVSLKFEWDGESAILIVIRDVSERETARQAMSESEARYRDVIEGSTLGIQISRPDGGRIFVNRKFVEMLGYDTVEEVLAITEPGAIVAPHDRDRIVAIRKARKRGEPAPEIYEFDALRKDGTFIPVEVFVRELIWDNETAIQRTFIDISIRRQAENAMRESEERYRTLSELSPDGMLVHTDDIIVFANPALADILGYGSPRDMIGMNALDMVAPDLRQQVLEHRKNKDGQEFVVMTEGRYIRADGSETFVERVSTPIVWEGMRSNLVLIRDINGRKRIEAERERMLKNLLAAQNRIEEQSRDLKAMADRSEHDKQEALSASQAKSDFLALMSHELRTPLNAILGFSDIIANETIGSIGNPKYKEYADDINISGQHLLDLINDILDLSKVESGNEEIYDEIIDINDLFSQLETLAKERSDRENVHLYMECPDDIPLLCGDKRKVKQILVNLLSNAIKFTPEGGSVTLKVWCQSGSGHVFQVADTGIGIAEKDIPKALAPFQQVSDGLSRNVEGTGLGLPLSKSLAELHGGSLELKSEIGVGTTVTVRFPVERVVMEAGPGKRHNLESA